MTGLLSTLGRGPCNLARREIEMASDTTRRSGNTPSNAVDQVKNVAAGAAKSVGDALDSGREQLADAMDDAADTMGEKRKRATETVTRYSRYAKATFRKDRRLNIRLSSKDLEAIQKRALAEGLPYQTLIASLLHKYASGRLKEV